VAPLGVPKALLAPLHLVGDPLAPHPLHQAEDPLAPLEGGAHGLALHPHQGVIQAPEQDTRQVLEPGGVSAGQATEALSQEQLVWVL
jgi:hypothetical protein